MFNVYAESVFLHKFFLFFFLSIKLYIAGSIFFSQLLHSSYIYILFVEYRPDEIKTFRLWFIPYWFWKPLFSFFIDVNECGRRTDTCGANTYCANIPGSYSCPCNSGYTQNPYVRNSCKGKRKVVLSSIFVPYQQPLNYSLLLWVSY